MVFNPKEAYMNNDVTFHTDVNLMQTTIQLFLLHDILYYIYSHRYNPTIVYSQLVY